MTGWASPADLTESILTAAKPRRFRGWGRPVRAVLLVGAAVGQLALTVPLLSDAGWRGLRQPFPRVTRSALRRRAGSAAALSLLVAVLMVWGAAAAAAHSVLLATTPAESSRVATAPASVVLTFNEMPRGEYSNIHIVGPDNARRDSGHVKVLNDTVTEDLGGARPAGTYIIDWRVISADGHPVSGQFSFTATSAASPLAARQPDSTSTTAEKKSSSSAVLIVVVVVVLVVLVAIALFFAFRRKEPVLAGRQSKPEKDEDE